MKHKKRVILIIIGIVLCGIVFKIFFMAKGKKEQEVMREISPFTGTIKKTISITGMVKPQNRLEIKPSIGGRIEEIFVEEGDLVKVGQKLALMSSTERAALLDAARAKGKKELQYWQKAYKPIPIIAPIDGMVIARSAEKGQSLTAATVIMVISDRLIVIGDVDETDIGRVHENQQAEIQLDAYPENVIKGTVDHIAYESTLVNNVTIYEVEILPENIPTVFRSGMSANVLIIEESKDNILLIPIEAVAHEEGKAYVTIINPATGDVKKQSIELGLSDEKNYEVVSGISQGDTLIIKSAVLYGENKRHGGSPFSPFRRKKKK